MKTIVQHNTRTEGARLLDRVLIGAGLFLLMVLAGVRVARSAGTLSSPAAAPSTTAYHFSSHPMIAGTVVTVNDREMVVNTDQGEQMTLAIDSRTMAPRDLAPGMVMRAEFVALEDCRFYAERIMPIRRGISTNRLQAYAVTQDSSEAMAHKTSDLGSDHAANTMSSASVGNSPQPVGEHSLGMAMRATPTTADYHSSTRPMVSGRVISVNDHRLVVQTEQGQLVGLVMDSHTMVPGEVAPGAFVRAEFSQMKDGRYYANRIRTVLGGVADREQAYADTRDSDLMMAQNISDCGYVSAEPANTVTSALEVAATPAVAEQSVPQPVVEKPETLPQTASSQPFLLLFGLSALGSAGLIAIVRGARLS